MSNRILIAISLFFLLTTITSQQKLILTNFNLKKINIENNFLLKEADLKNQLNQFYGKNLIFLKNIEVEKALLKNSFIESFTLRKEYPNTLKIKIFEKKPLAILINKKKKFYLSEKVDLIKFQNFKNYEKLPLVLGNQEEFRVLYDNLKEISFPINHIKNFTLYESNRWDLETVDQIIIKLPPKNYIKSLGNFLTIKGNENFTKYKIFDYRIKDQLILK